MMTRRKFLRRAAWVSGISLGGLGSGTAYGFWEASQIRVRRDTIPVPNLPAGFTGMTVGVLADLHHGPFVGLAFIREAVRIANALKPDLFALVGDYAHKGNQAEVQLPPCLEVLSALRAPLGVFAVPGNHDMPRGGRLYRELIAATPLTDLTNRNQSVTRNGSRLWVAGVDDLWWGKPDLGVALAGVPDGAAVVTLSHNPDFAEDKPDARVGLVLSGHTHGGQVYLPGAGTLWLPSKYGDKYRSGFVRGPVSGVFVSRGLGEAGVPLRVNVPPEINLLTLVPAQR
jgi:predicted MPP superfamily phosphohydrolase